VKEADVQRWLDRSDLIPDAAELAEAARAMSPEQLWGALEAEDAFFRALDVVRRAAPTTPAERKAWHESVWVVETHARLPALLNRLHELHVPRRLAEAFRSRQVEGL